MSQPENRPAGDPRPSIEPLRGAASADSHSAAGGQSANGIPGSPVVHSEDLHALGLVNARQQNEILRIEAELQRTRRDVEAFRRQHVKVRDILSARDSAIAELKGQVEALRSRFPRPSRWRLGFGHGDRTGPEGGDPFSTVDIVSSGIPGSEMEVADVALIAASGYFDAQVYAGYFEAGEQGLDPIVHYLRVGEAGGLTPSAAFDPADYAAANPDVPTEGGNLLLHYLRHGKAEGRELRPSGAALGSGGETADAALIAASGYFDVQTYAGRFEAQAQGLDPIVHYLNAGEAMGLAPSREFDPVDYAAANPDVAAGGGNLLLHYLRYGKAEGRALQPSEATLGSSGEAADAGLIAASGYFDAQAYAGRLEAQEQGLDPVVHYLRVGEAAGLAASAEFDPVAYAAVNPDVAAGGGNLLLHYLRYGKAEGRTLPVASGVSCPPLIARPGRDTVLVMFHEATRTGAPILGYNIVLELRKKYNVVCLLKRGGQLEEAIRASSQATVSLPDSFFPHDVECDLIVEKIARTYKPRYAIANSVETRCFVPPLEIRNIPVIALVHEFSTYDWLPLGSLQRLYETASRLVFPAQMVADSSLSNYPVLSARTYSIHPQGRSLIPQDNRDASSQQHPEQMRDAIPAEIDVPKESILVIGLGKITPRKGVEFFIAAAAYVARSKTDKKFTFLWIGSCNPEDIWYLNFLREQVTRSGVEHIFSFAPEVEDLAPIYERAQLCFLSSRLDPLPNVAIDAAVEGIPVICFDRASGIAEQLSTHDTLSQLVIPYLDSEAAARALMAAAADLKLQGLSENIANWAHATFNMSTYVDTLDRLAQEACIEKAEIRAEARSFEDRNGFNADLFLSRTTKSSEWEGALHQYLAASRLVNSLRSSTAGQLVRRPLQGFHPLVYAATNSNYIEGGRRDPLTHYIESGRPDGPWARKIIRHTDNSADIGPNLKICVHGHFHYPDLLQDLLRRCGYRNDFYFFLTCTTEESAEILNAIVPDQLRHRVEVRLVPNIGRDLAPLLTALRLEIQDFDILLHVHGKRTPHRSPEIGERWRNFLWDNLIGESGTMADSIIAEFTKDPKLGLVFPTDPYLNGWNENRPLAEKLARQMGITVDLPTHFDFPQGSMFWARPDALTPLLNLDLAWADYPTEPIPADGTVLHAIERLLPFSAAQAGYTYAVAFHGTSFR